MAKNLLEKLTLLLQTNLTPDFTRRAGKNLDKEVAALRQQLTIANSSEAAIQTQITRLTETILKWDAEADTALKAGKDSQARYAIQQMETEKQRLTMAQAELDAHRQTMATLMRQLNEFESILQTAQQSQDEAEAETETLSDAIRRARESVEIEVESVPEQIDIAIDEEHINQEIAVRRSRLAKPDA